MALGAGITIFMETFAPDTTHLEIWLAMSVVIGALGLMAFVYGLSQDLRPFQG